MTTDKFFDIRNRYFLVFLVFLAYLSGCFIRFQYASMEPSLFFSSESAYRFHCIRMIALGQNLPAIDYKAQYPEGLNFLSRNTVLMEYTIGYLYRLFHCRCPIMDFIRFFIPFWASLSIFAIYFTVKELSKNSFSGIVAALFYAVANASAFRESGWEVVHDPFTLPFILFHIYFFIKALKERKNYYALISGILLSLALVSWKISQFYFFIYVVFIAINFIFNKDEPRLYESFIYSLIPVILTAIVIPFLRDSLFLCSYPMVIAYSVFIAHFFKRLNRKIKIAPRIIFFLVAILLIFILPQTPRYSHVYQMLFYKIIFLGQKPQDPSLLPFETRALWVDPFVSPSLFEIIHHFAILIILAIAPISHSIYKFFRRKITTAELFILYNAVVFFFVFLLIHRLRGFFASFLMIFIGLLVIRILSYRKKWRVILISLVFSCLIIEASKTFPFKGSDFPAKVLNRVGLKERGDFYIFWFTDAKMDLINWIRENTAEDSVILAPCKISPLIRTYTERAVNLTPLFESKDLRDKVKEFQYALFDKEEAFTDFCLKHGVNYVVYTMETILDDSINSDRYLADRLSLNEEMTAYKMHFLPDKLKNFILVYENERFRVYKINDKRYSDSGMWQGPHPLFYRHDLFEKFSGSTYAFYEYTKDTYRSFLLGNKYLSEGKYEEAQEKYKNALELVPDFDQPYMGLSIVAQQQGDYDKAQDYYDKYMHFR